MIALLWIDYADKAQQDATTGTSKAVIRPHGIFKIILVLILFNFCFFFSLKLYYFFGVKKT
jgi:hypothetical protein